MRHALNVLAGLVTLLVAGCVAYSPVVDSQATVKPGMAYLTGIFTDVSTQGGSRTIGITYENADNLSQHTFAFRKEQGRGELQVVEVPPGTYRAKSWFMAGITNEVMVRGELKGALFLRTFKVEPGQVYFMGEYSGSGTVTTSGNMIYRNAQMRALRITPTPIDRGALVDKYPNVGKLPLKSAYE